MSMIKSVPALDAARKPPHGQPCTRCGVCCMTMKCALAEAIFGPPKNVRCPALVGGPGQQYECGAVKEPARYRPEQTAKCGEEAMRLAGYLLIGANTGCDCRINGEKPNMEFYKVLELLDLMLEDEIALSREMWGVAAS